MGTLMIILNQVFHQGEGMMVRRYGKKYGSGGMFFNAIICFFAMTFFIFTDEGGLQFPAPIWIYGIIDCIMFAAGFYSVYVSLQLGSYAITKLISSFSAVISILYGIVFLHEKTNIVTYIAFVLIFVSVFLMNYKNEKETHDAEKKAVSFKWFLSVMVTVISNGFISVILRMQQLKFENAYDNEFMIISLGGAFVILFIIGLFTERERFTHIFKHGSLYGAVAGLCNGAANFVNLFILNYIPISIATPLKTGVGIVASFAISVLLYKEKFTKRQLAGAFTGFAALMLLKISQSV